MICGIAEAAVVMQVLLVVKTYLCLSLVCFINKHAMFDLFEEVIKQQDQLLFPQYVKQSACTIFLIIFFSVDYLLLKSHNNSFVLDYAYLNEVNTLVAVVVSVKFVFVFLQNHLTVNYADVVAELHYLFESRHNRLIKLDANIILGLPQHVEHLFDLVLLLVNCAEVLGGHSRRIIADVLV